jgi:hypothetical protein
MLLLLACTGAKDPPPVHFDWGELPLPIDVIGEVVVAENPAWDSRSSPP